MTNFMRCPYVAIFLLIAAFPVIAYSSEEPYALIGLVVQKYINYEETKNIESLNAAINKNAQLFLSDGISPMEVMPFQEVIKNLKSDIDVSKGQSSQTLQAESKCSVEQTEIFDNIAFVRLRLERILTCGMKTFKYKYITLMAHGEEWKIISVASLETKFEGKQFDKENDNMKMRGLLQIWQISK